MQLTVACVKSKPAYDAFYVNRLYEAVKANLTVDHRFVCLTDDPDGIECETLPLPRGLEGWWAKMALFKPGVFDGPVLYLDLDTIILGNIDFLAGYKGDFAILRDFYRPHGYGSGIMFWNKPRHDIWGDWVKCGCPTHQLGDQGWIERCVYGADRLQDLFPKKIVSYKVHCESGPPADAAIVCFHGVPKPDEFPAEHWVTEAWL